VQDPSATQQEPVGCGQEFGTQTPFSVQTLGAMQFASVVTVQAPVGSQHDPFAATMHGFGLHVRLAAAVAAVQVKLQFASNVMVQPPVGVQHVPAGNGQGVVPAIPKPRLP
jgi:hypothetical protein